MPKAETGSVRAESSVDEQTARQAREAARRDDDIGDHGPVVRQWSPPDNRPPPAPSPPAQSRMEDDVTQCPEGTVMNGLTGICDSSSAGSDASLVGSLSASMPSGYGSVMAASAGSLVGLAVLMNCWPQLKSRLSAGLASKSSGVSGIPSARFKDIGQRRSEEERGLMSSCGDEDEDML